MDIRIQCLAVDSTDPQKIAAFWEQALGWRRTGDEDSDDEVCIEPRQAAPRTGSPRTSCS